MSYVCMNSITKPRDPSACNYFLKDLNKLKSETKFRITTLQILKEMYTLTSYANLKPYASLASSLSMCVLGETSYTKQTKTF